MESCTIAIWGFLVVYYFKGVATMAATEAQLRANKKYHSKFHRMQIRVTEEEKQLIDAPHSGAWSYEQKIRYSDLCNIWDDSRD